jgi:hypothetical protein
MRGLSHQINNRFDRLNSRIARITFVRYCERLPFASGVIYLDTVLKLIGTDGLAALRSQRSEAGQVRANLIGDSFGQALQLCGGKFLRQTCKPAPSLNVNSHD